MKRRDIENLKKDINSVINKWAERTETDEDWTRVLDLHSEFEYTIDKLIKVDD